MMAFGIAFVAVMLALVGAKTSYPFFRYLSGFVAWLLGVYLIYDPLVTNPSPVNNIAITLCFIGGIGVMFWANWSSKDSKGEGFNIRIPRFLGGQSEEDEAENTRRMSITLTDRQRDYNRKIARRIRGDR